MLNNIKSYTIPPNIEKKLFKFPKNIRDKFFSSLEKLLEDPSYPALRNKKVEGCDDWEFSITIKYRATYITEGSTLLITNIGKHEDIF
ncbi:hypothetical protein KJ633_08265 [bacterium]|nr:hypothetical protein [bacterium]MBU3956442.1 hypothetical protein [bacterium]